MLLSYRLVAQRAIHHAHALNLEVMRLRAQLAAVRDELRRYTAAAASDRRAA